jgi:hypothetical protein
MDHFSVCPQDRILYGLPVRENDLAECTPLRKDKNEIADEINGIQ